ncbi:MAG: tetratricopeptide repeat protein [SAR324 cluster bacterium]|nr:tetratricopeptide repeat protein [SAR324 cluster bacterium]
MRIANEAQIPVHSGEPEETDLKDKVASRYALGERLYLSAQYLNAIEVFEELRKKYPVHPLQQVALYWIGRSYMALSEFSKASLILLDFTRSFPTHAMIHEARWYLAQSLEQSGEIRLAMSQYNELAKSGNPFQQQAKDRLNAHEKQP